MISDQKSLYKQALKATSIFGGVQVFNILVSIVRSKFIAVLLGPVGIGISTMLSSTTGIISSLTNFGLGTSAVRDISAANETRDSKRIAIIAIVLNRWLWITGILGLILTLLLSPWLSYLSFGNYEYTLSFLVLSITLLLNQLNSGHLVVLQGMRKISLLAKANLAGSLIGLFTSVPLYYVWGVDGIVPALIVASLVSCLVSYSYRKGVIFERVKVGKDQTIVEGKHMLRMGFLISVSGFMTLGSSYLIRLFIAHEGSISEVGLFNAGFAIVTTYVGLVFAAMGTDYYPRLSAVANDEIKANILVNNQIEMVLMILGPIVVFLISFVNPLVNILYSDDFLNVRFMVVWSAYGMLFKSVSWSIGYLILARTSNKIFFWTELSFNIVLMILSLTGYNYFGLVGLGYSFVAAYFIHLVLLLFIAKYYYNYNLGIENLIVLITQMIFASCSILILYLFNDYIFFIMSIFLLLLNILYSYRKLAVRIR